MAMSVSYADQQKCRKLTEFDDTLEKEECGNGGVPEPALMNARQGCTAQLENHLVGKAGQNPPQKKEKMEEDIDE